jgi:hypothetical protein
MAAKPCGPDLCDRQTVVYSTINIARILGADQGPASSVRERFRARRVADMLAPVERCPAQGGHKQTRRRLIGFAQGGTTMYPSTVRAFFVISAFLLAGSPALAQSGYGWITLLDGKSMGEWSRIGESNWRMEDGAVVADKRTSKGAAHLVSKKKYKNFQLHVEFWSSDDANSGVFLRCKDPKKASATACYEVNIFDKRKDPTYGTGAIVNFVEVVPMPKAGGKWNTFEITADGRHLVVVINGKKTVDTRNGLFKDGHITLQHGGGTIKFRKVAIKPL